LNPKAGLKENDTLADSYEEPETKNT